VTPVQVMGVLNVTPDSFSDGGRFDDPVRARDHVADMLDQGAACIDVGGESTRPGAAPIDPVEECRRVLPVLEAVAPLVAERGARLSIDTRNADTARAAVAAGATLLNDVSASLWDVAAELGVGWVAMHMAGDPRTMQEQPHYDDVVDEVRRFLVERANAAVAAGVPEVWVDPGIGFGKTTGHNLDLLAHLDVLVAEGFPVLVGTSRKRFTGELLARSDLPGRGLGDLSVDLVGAPVAVEDRVDGSLATATWAMVHGARMVRAHDVAVTSRAATIVSGGFPTT
jgi:dihydropteroate synthase